MACAPHGLADGLPDLGEVERTALSVAAERRLGERIMLEIRRDPAYLDDAEVADYLGRLGGRLAAHVEGARPAFEFFAVRDPMLNAFALPGGFIGVHTGLILAARNESELAGVLAHEIVHVTQSHLARMLGAQNQGQLWSMLALAAAILAAKSHPDVAMGAAVAGQAAGIQNQLNYSRDFEREADRLGLELLERAGFDPRGMASFFERLWQFGRLYENNAPAYLRTHPLTTERITDMENRLARRPYRQVPDSADFVFIRAKLRAQEGTPAQAVAEFVAQLTTKQYPFEAAARFGLAHALLRAGRVPEAEAECMRLAEWETKSALVAGLMGAVLRAKGDAKNAVLRLAAARASFPDSKPLLYALIDAQIAAGRAGEAERLAREEALATPGDARLWRLLARAAAEGGHKGGERRAMAEAYVLEGRLDEAIRQLELAREAGGDYFEQSQIDARLAELRRRRQEEAKERSPWR
ncbi:MAG: M48 family metalloprotease [Rhodocyclaceae bacterium]|nr:M48 family metalloprotease [Rhodocyclaceae bacterium]